MSNIQSILNPLAELVDLIVNADDSEDRLALVTALRGPDNDNDILKRLTTCRIRSIFLYGLSPSIDPNNRHSSTYHFSADGYAIRDLPLTPEEFTMRDKLLGDAPMHFANHYNSAVAAIINIYHYDLLTEKQILE